MPNAPRRLLSDGFDRAICGSAVQPRRIAHWTNTVIGYQLGIIPALLILAKFLLTIAAVIVVLLHMPTVSRVAEMTLSNADPGALRIQLLVHAAGGLLVLLTATALSIYKPWGKIRYWSSQRY
jgi:hypothetical protein